MLVEMAVGGIVGYLIGKSSRKQLAENPVLKKGQTYRVLARYRFHRKGDAVAVQDKLKRQLPNRVVRLSSGPGARQWNVSVLAPTRKAA